MLPPSLPPLESKSTNSIIKSAQMMVLTNELDKQLLTVWINEGRFGIGKNHPKYLIVTYEEGFETFMPEYADTDEKLHESLKFCEASNTSFCQGIINLYEDIDPQIKTLKIVKK